MCKGKLLIHMKMNQIIFQKYGKSFNGLKCCILISTFMKVTNCT